MNKYHFVLVLIGLSTISLWGQKETLPLHKHFFSQEWTFSAYNNAIALPLSGRIGIIHAPFHPGISVTRNHYWNTSQAHQIFQTFTAGLFYQQYVQTGVQLYSALNYRYQTPFNLGLAAHLGFGYLHAFRDLQQFKLNENQEYEKKVNLGRPGLMIPFGVSLSYKINESWQPFLGYQMWFQTPFSKEYISILPNTSLHFGTTYTPKN